MDDAFCGGPDGVSVNSTGRLVSDGVAKKTVAIILMGNPRHVDGVVFNVGSAVLPGVSCVVVFYPFSSVPTYPAADTVTSLLPGRRALRVPSSRTGSRRTVMRRTRSARGATTRIRIRAMGRSMGSGRWSLWSARSARLCDAVLGRLCV